MEMDDACLDLWSLVLLHRPRDAAALRGLTDLDDDQLEARLATLEAARLVHHHDGRYESTPPETSVAGLLASMLDAQAKAQQQGYAEVLALLSRLPELVRHRSLGMTGEEWLRVEVAHGVDAPRDIRIQLDARRAPNPARASLPDAAHMVIPPPEFQHLFLERLAAQGGPDRVLVTPEGARAPAAQEAINVYSEAGIQFRMLPRLPSWFAVEDSGIVALPLRWGDAWPSSVVAIEHPGLAGLVRTLFDLLWDAGQELHTRDRSWSPLLRLMANGATVESASRALGVTDRTGRRRVAAAMEHYGTETLFELGIAFGRDELGGA